MNIHCKSCEYMHKCTDCMYNEKQKEHDLEQEQKETDKQKVQKKTADIRSYKRQKKQEARQRELAEEFPFLYGNIWDGKGENENEQGKREKGHRIFENV